MSLQGGHADQGPGRGQHKARQHPVQSITGRQHFDVYAQQPAVRRGNGKGAEADQRRAQQRASTAASGPGLPRGCPMAPLLFLLPLGQADAVTRATVARAIASIPQRSPRLFTGGGGFG